ncbi:hypothetical protein CA982_02170 [Gordonia lacunae]|uniref:Uncharacterized protein n=1 Tax=Gordonia lacunae TaxID=417102 RepID=A0A243QFN7_9ACTN|nr:hypothetical protein CA982_02170 [Gordonia lacunae]
MEGLTSSNQRVRPDDIPSSAERDITAGPPNAHWMIYGAQSTKTDAQSTESGAQSTGTGAPLAWHFCNVF